MFSFIKLELDGLCLVTPQVFADERGFFMELYKKSEFQMNGIKEDFCQDNCSQSARNVLRGLHYQAGKYAQGKLVRCLQGVIFDVAVDIRQDSNTYCRWYGVILSDQNHKMLYIPAGFAHGFLTISETATVLYKTTKEYSPEADRGIIWNDKILNINWGIKRPILSPKDKAHPTLQGT